MANLPDLKIKIDGTALPDEELDDVIEVVVNTDRYLPGMFTLLLNDTLNETTGKPLYVDQTKFDLGKSVEIIMQGSEAQPDQSGASGTVITGEITSIEPNFDHSMGINLIVRGYEKSHRLHRGTYTRTFLKQSDSDIASKIAGEAGLSAQVDSTSEKHEYVMQYNQTNMEFLRARAARIGYEVYVNDTKLCFKKGSTKTSGPPLEWGMELHRFEPRMSGAHQVDKATVKSWDHAQKKPIVGQASSSQIMPGGVGKSGGQAAKSAFGGSATAIIVDQPVGTASDATTMAQAELDRVAGEFIQAEGVCEGDPRVQAGKEIEIKGVGQRFSGKYIVTSATHVFSHGQYETRFTVGGREDNTLSRLVSRANADEPKGRVPGVVVGVVTNIKDPDKNGGRVKVKFPWLDDALESQWARVAMPSAGKGRGFFFMPEVDDEVLVAFDHDDINYPYIIGALWNTKDTPPEKVDTAIDQNSGVVNQRYIKSRSGHVILLNDKSGEEQIVIRDKTGNNEIVINSKDNKMSLKVDKDFSIEAKGNITIKTSGGDMTLECNNYNVKAKAKVAMEGQGGVEMKTSATMKIEGTMTEIKASATGKFDGGGMLELKGGLVKIN